MVRMHGRKSHSDGADRAQTPGFCREAGFIVLLAGLGLSLVSWCCAVAADPEPDTKPLRLDGTAGFVMEEIHPVGAVDDESANAAPAIEPLAGEFRTPVDAPL